MPLVSVVIPSYNHEAFLGAAVQSVLNQTLRDLELIVVDDGSSDGSLAVLEGFSDPRLKVHPQANQGAHAAINRGLDLASGEYLSILNSDDLYHPQRLEKLVRVLQDHPQAGLAGSYVQVIDTVGAPLGVKHGYHDLEPWALSHPERSFRVGEDLRVVLLAENYWATTSNYSFSRRWFEQVGPFQPLRYTHDWDFALRMARQAELLMLPEPLLSYRVHPANTIRENQAAMIYEICWILAVHLPQACETAWFKARKSSIRFGQLLESLYTYQCDRVLALLLLQDLAGHPELALDLLRPDHPLRARYLEFIRARLEDEANRPVAPPSPLRRIGSRLKARLKGRLR